jgi:hypothetical protein
MSRLYVIKHNCGHDTFLSRDQFSATHYVQEPEDVEQAFANQYSTPISPGTLCDKCSLDSSTYSTPYQLAHVCELSDEEISEAASFVKKSIKPTMRNMMKEISRITQHTRASPEMVPDTTLEWLQGTYRAMEITLRRKMKVSPPTGTKLTGMSERILQALKPSKSLFCCKQCTSIITKALTNIGLQIAFVSIEHKHAEIMKVLEESASCHHPPSTKKPLIAPVPPEEITEIQQCLICHIPIGESDPDDSESVVETPCRLPCTHIFGNECLGLWLEDHGCCPICRKEFSKAEYKWPERAARQLREPNWIRYLRGEAPEVSFVRGEQ